MAKDIFGIFGDLFGDDWFSRFNKGLPESTETERITVVKNGVETVINVAFNKEGYPISSYITSAPSRTHATEVKIKDLEQAKLNAIEAEDYELAQKIKKEIDELRKPTTT